MTNDALAKAEERKAEKLNEIGRQKNVIADAESRISRLQTEVADLDAFISMWHLLTGTPTRPTAAERIEINEKSQKRTRPKNLDKSLVADMAVSIIAERGSPIPRKELYEALREVGLEIQGKDPEMVLSTMLWREADKVVRLPPFGYWPKTLPYPLANYDPAFEAVLGATATGPEDGVEAEDAHD